MIIIVCHNYYINKQSFNFTSLPVLYSTIKFLSPMAALSFAFVFFTAAAIITSSIVILLLFSFIVIKLLLLLHYYHDSWFLWL